MGARRVIGRTSTSCSPSTSSTAMASGWPETTPSSRSWLLGRRAGRRGGRAARRGPAGPASVGSVRPSRSTIAPGSSRVARRTTEAGRAILSCPTRSSITDSPRRATGTSTVKVVPLPRLGVDEDLAAHAVDGGGHHVQADAAAGDLRDLLAGGEARREEQAQRLLLAHARRRSRHPPAPPPPRCWRTRAVSMPPPSSAMTRRTRGPSASGLDADAAGARLAPGLAHLRRLDAVIDGVAHQVEQRLLQLAGDAAVEPGLLAFELHLDLAPQRAAPARGRSGRRRAGSRASAGAAARASSRAAPRPSGSAAAARPRAPPPPAAAWWRARPAPASAAARAGRPRPAGRGRRCGRPPAGRRSP